MALLVYTEIAILKQLLKNIFTNRTRVDFKHLRLSFSCVYVEQLVFEKRLFTDIANIDDLNRCMTFCAFATDMCFTNVRWKCIPITEAGSIRLSFVCGLPECVCKTNIFEIPNYHKIQRRNEKQQLNRIAPVVKTWMSGIQYNGNSIELDLIDKSIYCYTEK